MKNRNDPAELLHYSEKHLMHEIAMLRETAVGLNRHEPRSTEYVALLESFATHLRNLIEFLFEPIKRDYVRALHFFENPDDWKPTKTPEWQSLYDRACREVSHLTIWRAEGDPQVWNVSDIVTKIHPILGEFATKASPKMLHPRVREFFQQPESRLLTWIADNVHHANAAISGPFGGSYSSGSNASTQKTKLSSGGSASPVGPGGAGKSGRSTP